MNCVHTGASSWCHEPAEFYTALMCCVIVMYSIGASFMWLFASQPAILQADFHAQRLSATLDSYRGASDELMQCKADISANSVGSFTCSIPANLALHRYVHVCLSQRAISVKTRIIKWLITETDRLVVSIQELHAKLKGNATSRILPALRVSVRCLRLFRFKP